MQEFLVKNVKETKKLANKLAKTLIGCEVILLSGDLGAGKTTFTKELFKKLGCKQIVTSPTFNLIREYQGKKFNLYHLDMYRIEDENEVFELGLNEYLFKENSIVVIEWFEKIVDNLIGKFIKIDIQKLDETKRKFIINRDFEI